MTSRLFLRRVFGVLLAVVAIAGALHTAETGQAQGGQVTRDILVLYDSSVSETPTQTAAHRFLEMPFNHKGYKFAFRDIQAPLPVLQPGDYAGIITWFKKPVQDWRRYFEWAAEAGEKGFKFLVIGDIGLTSELGSVHMANRFARHLGIEILPRFHADPLTAEYETVDETMFGFERPLPALLPSFFQVETTGPGTRTHLSARFDDGATWKKTALVTSSPGGVFVPSAFMYFYDPHLNRTKWIVDPFVLVDLLTKGKVFPVPDTTTVAGRRMYFSHIDGDGWKNISMIDRYRKDGSITASVLLEELIKPYPDLPVTIGMVTGDLDPKIGGSIEAKGAARQIYAQKQVELASHTHTHPFYWSFFEDYDRNAETLRISDNERFKQENSRKSIITSVVPVIEARDSRQRISKYIAGGQGEMPRAFMRHPFKLDTEIGKSLRMVERLAPSGSTAQMLLWSGNTLPFEAAIRETRNANVRNMNGGDPRYDFMHPSLMYVPALSRTVGSERQIYAAASNENTYTDDWTGYYYAFGNLRTTVEKTGAPRRLKPFNLYYHLFAVERAETLEAIKDHLAEARSEAYIPVRASRYAAGADAFFDVKIEELGPSRWAVSNHQGLSTYRFDAADDMTLDWGRSMSVIGMTRANRSLYVAIDSSAPAAVIALAPKDRVDNAKGPIWLDNSRWEVFGVVRQDCGLTFRVEGYGPGTMLWNNVPPGRYQIRVLPVAGKRWQEVVSVGDDRQLRLFVDRNAQKGAVVSVACAPQPELGN